MTDPYMEIAFGLIADAYKSKDWDWFNDDSGFFALIMRALHKDIEVARERIFGGKASLTMRDFAGIREYGERETKPFDNRRLPKGRGKRAGHVS